MLDLDDVPVQFILCSVVEKRWHRDPWRETEITGQRDLDDAWSNSTSSRPQGSPVKHLLTLQWEHLNGIKSSHWAESKLARWYTWKDDPLNSGLSNLAEPHMWFDCNVLAIVITIWNFSIEEFIRLIFHPKDSIVWASLHNKTARLWRALLELDPRV